MSGASRAVLSSRGRLVGREREREVLDRLLAGARGGHGGMSVVHGEAGVGRTAMGHLYSPVVLDDLHFRFRPRRELSPLARHPHVVRRTRADPRIPCPDIPGPEPCREGERVRCRACHKPHDGWRSRGAPSARTRTRVTVSEPRSARSKSSPDPTRRRRRILAMLAVTERSSGGRQRRAPTHAPGSASTRRAPPRRR
jgi:hypothetical protein